MRKHNFLFAIAFLFCVSIAFAESTPIENLYEYKLKNGLTLFVAENHNVPLSYIEIAVRCGAYTQEKETAGLFHLYEHMMFKGNALYKDAASVNRALSDMGVSEWNGTTGLECVNYYFTVPSEMTEKGLEFWSAAIRTPKMDKNEFEAEKKVVISEINGSAADSSHILMEARTNSLFSDAPYTLSPSGTEESVSAATLSQLKKIQKQYYVPNNSAVFVGGDVNPDEVFKMVEKIFGSWKKGKNPFSKGIVKHSQNPFEKTVFKVMPYDKLSDELAQILVEYRGPDAAYELKDTYPIDILSNLMENPAGTFKNDLVNNPLLGIPDTNYVGGGYQTRKTCGVLSFYAMLVQPELDIAERAKYFSETLPKVLQKTAESATENELKKICSRLEDDNIIQSQTAQGLLSTVRFWWTVCDENYYYTYNKKMSQITNIQLLDFVKKYVDQKNPLVTVLVSPNVYEKTKNQFENFDFEEISVDKN